jgi:hypothetical protein
MYKNHISKWGLDKKNKSEEMKAILRKKTGRSQLGKKSCFTLRGRPVDMVDVERYLRRNRITVRDVMPSGTGRPITPASLRCYTPKAVPRSPRSPIVYEMPQQIFDSIKLYLSGSIQAGHWVSDRDDSHCRSANYDPDAAQALISLYDCLSAACVLVGQGELDEAGLYMVKACSKIEIIVRAQEPDMLRSLLDATLKVIDLQCVGLMQTVLKQVSAISSVYLTPFHPLHIIFAHLSRLENRDLVEVTLRARHVLSDHFEDALGEFHLSTLSCKMDRLRASARYSRSTDLNSVVQSVRTLLEKCEEKYGKSSARSHVLLKRLGDISMISGRYAEVETAGYELMVRATEIDDAQLWRMGARLVAGAQYQQNKAEEAESSYRHLLHAYARLMGWRDPGTIRYMLDLEECLTGIGKLEDAAAIRAERLELASTMKDVILP